MQTEQINVKLMPDLAIEVDVVSKILHLPKNEWVRNVIAHEAKKEIAEHKSFIAIEYAKGTISKQHLVKVLGEQEAQEIDHLLEVSKQGFKDAAKLAKLMK